MSGKRRNRLAGCAVLGILFVVITTFFAPYVEAAGLFSVGAGYAGFQKSRAVIWDSSWYLNGTLFFDLRPNLQIGLSMSYCFLQPKSGSEIFGVGVMWEEPDGDGWMFSLVPAVRVPFKIGDDGSTELYLQGGFGWYRLDMDMIYSGSIPGFEDSDREREIEDSWDKPGIDGRFGVVTKLYDKLFLEISPGISVIFTDDESTWSLNCYAALALAM